MGIFYSNKVQATSTNDSTVPDDLQFYLKIIGIIGFYVLLVEPIGAEERELLPTGLNYRPYLASPLTPRFKLGRISTSSTGIPETSPNRWELKAGQTTGVLRWNQHWQMNVFGGLLATFDIEESTDSIAWDGVFGTQLTRKLSSVSTVKIGYSHQSAHRGDEFIERTGRTRIDYTRQEWNLGYSRFLDRSLRAYGEFGWATTLRNANLQDAGRWEAGLEYGIPRRYPNREKQTKSGWFGAVDLESMEERNWQIDSTLHAGYFTHKDSRLWRVGFEFRDGRSPYGEFFQSDETYWGVSVWNDFL